MLIEDFIFQFILMKKRRPLHTNELLRYLQACYTQGDVTKSDYKKLFIELQKRKVEEQVPFMRDCKFFTSIQSL
ncbi:YppF family protein [Metabacillus iocasae]|uniref:YppF-like protein n=1 Tax=Priestia iocasae TaxID=2291674 RepID=A0ABS2QYN7_9BACI|nr:YppF family protein [Metabacillus iocasae]MBM7703579.1 hypothetical protein [Metabacillus iocasae]